MMAYIDSKLEKIIRITNQVIGEEVGGYATLVIFKEGWKHKDSIIAISFWKHGIIEINFEHFKEMPLHEIVRVMIHEYCHLTFITPDIHGDRFYQEMEKFGCIITGERDELGYRKEYLSPIHPLVKEVRRRLKNESSN